MLRAERKVGDTLEKPIRDQGGRESNLIQQNNLPPLVPLTGETACPTLDFMTVRGPQAHRDRAEALAGQCCNFIVRRVTGKQRVVDFDGLFTPKVE